MQTGIAIRSLCGPKSLIFLLAFALSGCSEMRQAVGVSVFFGVLGVTLFGLIFTPDLLHAGPQPGRWEVRQEMLPARAGIVDPCPATTILLAYLK